MRITLQIFGLSLCAVTFLSLGTGCGTTVSSLDLTNTTVSQKTQAVIKTKKWTEPDFTVVSIWNSPPQIGFITDFNKAQPMNQFFSLNDFRDVHFWDHGYRFSFTLLSADILHLSTPTVPGEQYEPTIKLNRLMPIPGPHNPWVTSVEFQEVHDTVHVTCFLAQSGTRYSLGTTPVAFFFQFTK